MKNKRGFEFSFGWLFAIIAGGVIIFLAVFAAVRLAETEKEVKNTEIGKEIGILLTPIETSIENSKSVKIVVPSETRIYNDCSLRGNFGSQKISISTKSNIGANWPTPGVSSTFYNKYLFSEKISEGKSFYLVSFAFEFPFKVADIAILIPGSESYCFIDSPNEVKEDLENLNLDIAFVEDVKECIPRSKKVCFSSSGCDIDVNLNSKSVKKKKEKISIFYEGPLIYSAIFSSNELYECQLKRIMMRTSEISLLNLAKSEYLSGSGCNSQVIQSSLLSFSNSTRSISESIGLRQLQNKAEEIEQINRRLSCRLF